MQRQINVFAPATVANIACGFDILGFALYEPGDQVTLEIVDKPGVRIRAIHGDTNQIPHDIHRNTAGFAAHQFMKQYHPELGVELELFKQLPIGSGMGSSAAGAAAVLYGLNLVFDQIAPEPELLMIAVQAEAVACGSPHGDNVIPSLLGGIILIRGYNPLDIVRLPVPDELYCTLIHPHIEIKTADARKILPDSVPLKSAIQQWGNVAGLIAGLYRSDYDLIARSLQDVIIEPHRAGLIPAFQKLKQVAISNGALGCSISGSGPSVFALNHGMAAAKEVAQSMQSIYMSMGIEHSLYISGINREGPRVIQ
jgi:homoserine kinase